LLGQAASVFSITLSKNNYFTRFSPSDRMLQSRRDGT
jgi:hypothetical protein